MPNWADSLKMAWAERYRGKDIQKDWSVDTVSKKDVVLRYFGRVHLPEYGNCTGCTARPYDANTPTCFVCGDPRQMLRGYIPAAQSKATFRWKSTAPNAAFGGLVCAFENVGTAIQNGLTALATGVRRGG